MRQSLFNLFRASFLIALVAIMAAASAGVFHGSETAVSANASASISDSGKLQTVARSAMRAEPARGVKASPAAQRYPPEEFTGTVVAGSITQVAGTTQFVVDRAKKTGNTFDPTQREQVTCRLENVPSGEAALVVDGATLFVTGTYDPALGTFFVSRVGTQSSPPPAAAPAPADNTSSTDNSGDNSSDNVADNLTTCFSIQDNTDCSDNNDDDNSSSCFSIQDNTDCSDNNDDDNSSSCFSIQDNTDCSDNNDDDNSSSTNCFFILTLADNNSCQTDNSDTDNS